MLATAVDRAYVVRPCILEGGAGGARVLHGCSQGRTACACTALAMQAQAPPGTTGPGPGTPPGRSGAARATPGAPSGARKMLVVVDAWGAGVPRGAEAPWLLPSPCHAHRLPSPPGAHATHPGDDIIVGPPEALQARSLVIECVLRAAQHAMGTRAAVCQLRFRRGRGDSVLCDLPGCPQGTSALRTPSRALLRTVRCCAAGRKDQSPAFLYLRAGHSRGTQDRAGQQSRGRVCDQRVPGGPCRRPAAGLAPGVCAPCALVSSREVICDGHGVLHPLNHAAAGAEGHHPAGGQGHEARGPGAGVGGSGSTAGVGLRPPP